MNMLTTENQSVVAATITGFNNSQRFQNEYGSTSRCPQINFFNTGTNTQAVDTENCPSQMGDLSTNNSNDKSQISYNNFGKIINRFFKDLAKVTIKEVSVA